MAKSSLTTTTTTTTCWNRRYRFKKSLAVVAIGILTVLLMEYHVHRRFLTDISTPTAISASNVLLPKPLHSTTTTATTTSARNNNDTASMNQQQQLRQNMKVALRKKLKPTGSNFSIFYNIYLNPTNASNGIRIIEQQTRQIFTSDYHKDTPLYYNIIGLNYTKRFCPSHVTCHQLHYYPSGNEDLTLQELHDYCVRHPLDQVIYLHNKGSFSPHLQNEIKRKSVTHALCRPLTLHDKTCNVLTYTWEPLPHFHAQSNMWLAKCSYVAKLLPPKVYEQRRVEMFRELLQPPPSQPQANSKTGKLNKATPNKDDKYQCLGMLFNRSSSSQGPFGIYQQHEGLVRAVGMSRYIYELWVYSHPDLEPCDRDYTLGKPLLQRADATSMRFKHAWLRLPGRLWEYQYIYHQLPYKETSFFYKYFQNATEVKWPRHCRNDPLIVQLQQEAAFLQPSKTIII
jgi:hypothetical protein